MQEWDLSSDAWPHKDFSYRKVSNDACLEITMSIADEPDLPLLKALIEPVLRPRSKPAGIPGQPELRVQIPSVKEDLFWVVSVNGQRDDSERGLRTLEGAMREAELHLAMALAPIWQEYLARKFAREALADFDYLPTEI